MPAGTTVTADLAFAITIGSQAFDRFGRANATNGRYAWIGSGQPLLAWERGFGWHDEDLIQFTAESATSEAMDTDLTVHAPAKDTVIMSGDPADPTAKSSGNRTWHSHVAAARDVSVAVGPFAIADKVVQGVHLRLGAFNSKLRDQLVPDSSARSSCSRAVRPVPVPVAVRRAGAVAGWRHRVPEFDPDARRVAAGCGARDGAPVVLRDGRRLAGPAPVAGRGVRAVLRAARQRRVRAPGTLQAPGTVDKSTESYGNDVDDYYFVTYDKGAAALKAARDEAGPAKWDAALRCYVNANAWRIANPADLAAAFARLAKRRCPSPGACSERRCAARCAHEQAPLRR